MSDSDVWHRSSKAGTIGQTSFKIKKESLELKLVNGLNLKLSSTFLHGNLGDLLIILVTNTFPDSEKNWIAFGTIIYQRIWKFNRVHI